MKWKIIFLILLGAGIFLIKTPARTYFQPNSIIVPHHNVVAGIRRNFYSRISRLRPQTDTVILISPNHFSPDQTEVTYSDRNWTLQEGILEYDQKLGEAFAGLGILNPAALENDHGIFNQLADIKISFPESRVLPIMIGDRVSQSSLDQLAGFIDINCADNCLLVASVDFSHYLPGYLADLHDAYSLKILENRDTDAYANLEVDSPQSLYLVMKHAKARQSRTFNLFSHTNSGHLVNDPDVETTTHVFASYSRVFSIKGVSEPWTYSLAANLSRSKTEKGVGDRFYFGMDYINPKLATPFSPSARITVSPSEKSEITWIDGQLQIRLGPDLTVSGATSADSDALLFLPINTSSSAFLRSQERTEYLNRLFSSVASAGGLNVDPKSGIISLESK